MPEKILFRLIVTSREGKLYEGEVSSLTSYNARGKFDILAQHANFISLISKELEVVDAAGKSQRMPIDNGLLRTRGNVVEVYVGVEGLNPAAVTGVRSMSD